MIAHTIFFYFFSIIAVLAAIMVIISKNTVSSVFFLILDFISISCLFIMIGAEFLGMIMLIVYVGAVAVLFLFVVMMLNVGSQKGSWLQSQKISSHFPIGLLVGLIIFFEIIVVIGGWKYKGDFISNGIILNSDMTNTHLLGNILYTDYIHLFQVAGILLLMAMVGAVVLTFQKRQGVKKQNVFSQVAREKSESVKLVDPKSGQGVNTDD